MATASATVTPPKPADAEPTKPKLAAKKPQLRNEALEVLRNLFDFAEKDEGEPVFAEDDDLSANQPKPPVEGAPQE
jgi:hypothetical protein